MTQDERRALIRAQTLQLYHSRITSHRCVACNKRLAQSRRQRRCAACAKRRADWVREHQQELVKGLRCVNCGGKGATKKRKHCIKCLQRAKEIRETRRRGNVEAGFCVRCGKRQSLIGRTRCDVCSRAGRNYQRLLKTGFTESEYESFYTAQEGCCAICKVHKRRNDLHADHDHETNVKRGLLCWACNSGLGQFKDSPELLRAAATYLELG
jgi:hypothetical protein